jgi:hypothetical protein
MSAVFGHLKPGFTIQTGFCAIHSCRTFPGRVNTTILHHRTKINQNKSVKTSIMKQTSADNIFSTVTNILLATVLLLSIFFLNS